MFDIFEDSEHGIIRVAFSEEIQPIDYEVSGPAFEKIIKSRKPFRVLFDWSRFLGWRQAAESQAFLFSVHHRSDFERTAFVGESKWRSEVAYFDRIVDGEVRLFDTKSEDEAMRWLCSD